MLSNQSDTEAYHGRLKQARGFSQRAVESEDRYGAKEGAAGWAVNEALRDLLLAQQDVLSALTEEIPENAEWTAFNWFLGDNDLQIALYDPITGGCRDGLHPDRANENQGAESTLSFLMALLEMRKLEESDGTGNGV